MVNMIILRMIRKWYLTDTCDISQCDHSWWQLSVAPRPLWFTPQACEPEAWPTGLESKPVGGRTPTVVISPDGGWYYSSTWHVIHWYHFFHNFACGKPYLQIPSWVRNPLDNLRRLKISHRWSLERWSDHGCRAREDERKRNSSSRPCVRQHFPGHGFEPWRLPLSTNRRLARCLGKWCGLFFGCCENGCISPYHISWMIYTFWKRYIIYPQDPSRLERCVMRFSCLVLLIQISITYEKLSSFCPMLNTCWRRLRKKLRKSKHHLQQQWKASSGVTDDV